MVYDLSFQKYFLLINFCTQFAPWYSSKHCGELIHKLMKVEMVQTAHSLNIVMLNGKKWNVHTDKMYIQHI